MHVLLNDCESAFFVDMDCLEHGSHLITLGGLRLVDDILKATSFTPFKHFTSCAIVSNVMRDCAKDIYLEWCVTYGAQSANATVKKLMPKCNSGRWGSVHATEERFLKMEAEQLSTVLTTVLEKKVCKKSKPKSKPKPLDNDLNPDTLALEQSAEYTARMGKWRRYALETVQNTMWLKCIDLMHRARGPVMHFTNFVRAKLPKKDFRRFGGHICQLVNGKMDVMMAEFTELIEDNWRAQAHLSCLLSLILCSQGVLKMSSERH